jgi:hypothetical protein
MTARAVAVGAGGVPAAGILRAFLAGAGRCGSGSAK